ncbi:hypothetical protein ACFSHR_04155 [Azotobacter chroococcum]
MAPPTPRGAWECPDLFPLPVDGDSSRIKWVLLVSLNPGSIAGGSGMQYFVGDFDGTTFRADNVLGDYTPPTGELYQGFEERDYGEWSTTGTAFGSGPTSGTISPQGEVSGYLGGGLVNSYHEADLGTGTLTSPPLLSKALTSTSSSAEASIRTIPRSRTRRYPPARYSPTSRGAVTAAVGPPPAPSPVARRRPAHSQASSPSAATRGVS